MEFFIFFAVMAMVMLVVAGCLLEKGKMDVVAISLFLLGVLILIVVGREVREKFPTGQPMEISDGTYEVRMVDFYYGNKTEKDSFVLALVLKEEGKPGKNPPEYVKIPLEYFSAQGSLQPGKEITIEISPHKAAKKAVIKK